MGSSWRSDPFVHIRSTLLLVQGFGWGVDRVVGLLILQMQQRVPGILGRLDSPFPGILVVLLWSDRGPLGRGRYSSVGGHLMCSIASAGAGSLPFCPPFIFS